MKLLISILLLFVSSLSFTQITVRGVVTDQVNNPLPFVSIYEQNTSNATLTNDEGVYELIVKEGSIVIYQYLGYKTIQKKLSSNDKAQTFNQQLEEETFQLTEVEVTANSEDPAYPIIRKAILKRPQHYKENQTYQADLYVKGVIKIVDAPEKIMGQKVGNMDGIIDSNKQGIFYLSETQSTILKDGNREKEILHSSIVAGNDNGLGFNQFIKSNIDFYSKDIPIIRDMIGPLDDNAFTYYTYRLESTFIDQSNALVYRISVKPKSENRPCFEGEIYLLDESYCIHSLNLKTTGKAIKNPTFSEISIKQVHAPITKEQWRLITQTISFNAGLLVFKGVGNFNSVYSNYNISPSFADNTFGSVTFEADEDAIKNDTAFWNEKRPITLTNEEKTDYIRKETLQRVWESKAYLDSVDHVNNKFKLNNLLFGYSYNQSYKDQYFDFKSPLTTTNFNAVEGLNISIKPSYEHNDPKANTKFVLKGDLGFGFSDKRFKPFIDLSHTYDKMNLSSWSVEVGRQITDFSDFPIMAEISNSWHSLIFKNNFVRWHQNDIAKIGWQSEIVNTLRLMTSLSYEDRKSLNNSTNYSLREKDLFYIPNNPFDLFPENYFLNSKKVSLKTRLIWKPGQKIMKYPKSKVRLESEYPTIRLDIEYALPVGNEFQCFSKIELRIRDNSLKTGKIGSFEYNLVLGAFLKNGGDFPDYFHFVGHEVIPRYISKYQNTYKLLPYYILDNQNTFISTFMQHHFDGFIMDKVPFIKNIGWKLVVSAASLVREDIQYIEPGIGIEGIKVGPFDLFRFDYYWGFDQNGYRNKGFKFGFINFIDEGFRI